MARKGGITVPEHTTPLLLWPSELTAVQQSTPEDVPGSTSSGILPLGSDLDEQTNKQCV